MWKDRMLAMMKYSANEKTEKAVIGWEMIIFQRYYARVLFDTFLFWKWRLRVYKKARFFVNEIDLTTLNLDGIKLGSKPWYSSTTSKTQTFKFLSSLSNYEPKSINTRIHNLTYYLGLFQ